MAPAKPRRGQSAKASAEFDSGSGALRVQGDWIVAHALALDRELAGLKADKGQVSIDLSGLGKLDTTGALLIDRTKARFEQAGASVSIDNGSDSAMSLIDAIQKAEPKHTGKSHYRPGALIVVLERAGKAMTNLAANGREVLGFMGLIFVTLARTVVKPRRLRMISVVHHMEETGLNAVPIVMLMSFLIGAVLAYQGSQQLQKFGATIFTVDLVGISFMREIGILLTAILVAGRSGSAFTAQIGSMKMREEIDAMRTLGLDPVEMLIIPRILALVITLPLLGFLSSMAGLVGGGMVAVSSLGISPISYIQRLQQVLGVWTFWVGTIKAPFFAFLIASIGCFEGLRVSGSAESVGQRTTQSVVEGIFIVIIADAFFSILFVQLGI